MLEVKNLNKKYGKLTAVNDLSFQIEEGSIFGFVGPNGAGKTSTMKIISTLLKPIPARSWWPARMWAAIPDGYGSW
jgi:ABC-2 type transport system ATP-binding protein